MSQISDPSQSNLLPSHPSFTKVLMGSVGGKWGHHIRVQLWLEADLHILQCPIEREGAKISRVETTQRGHR